MLTETLFRMVIQIHIYTLGKELIYEFIKIYWLFSRW